MPPLQLGDEAQFRLVREFLDGCGYTEPAAAERIGFERLDQLGQFQLCDHAKRDRNLLIRDPLGVVVKLFLCGQALDSAEVQEFVPEPVRAAMQGLGLTEEGSSHTISPVLLYPAHGLYLTSDRYMNPDASAVSTGSDFVFLVLQRNVTDFINFTPDSACETFLDLAAGCGVAALWAAKNFAGHAWSADITERATHFAEFNRRLNGIAHATVVQGDMYAAVAGLRFDRITTHPPYAMSPKSRYVYADGGEDGETLIRRAISEAPQHLAPGGILTCTSMASD
ncbi:MAG: methyltransferase, partial [Bryobacteraceae bacterium]